VAHPNDPPRSQPEFDEGLEEGEVDDDEGNDGEITPGYEATPSTSAYSSFESNKLEDSTLCTEDNEEIEVEKEMAEDEEDS
jgi:hypothetical protein